MTSSPTTHVVPSDDELSARVRMVSLRSTSLSVDEVLAAVADPAAGGRAVFVGSVRDHDAGRDVVQLSYSAHPSASLALWNVALRVASSDGVIGVAAVHRLGELEVGDLAVVVAVSSAHRDVAFAHARRLIDELKAEVPIWKRQRFVDGGTEWVGAEWVHVDGVDAD